MRLCFAKFLVKFFNLIVQQKLKSIQKMFNNVKFNNLILKLKTAKSLKKIF
jgi:hypothetical protein